MSSDIFRKSTAGGGSGDVVGPALSVDNTIPRFNGITGKLLQGSGIVVDDADAMTFNNAAAPAILSIAATATVPTLIPNKADLDTGIGWAAANALSLISGATEALRITQTPVGAGQTVASLTHTKTAVLGKDTTNEAAFTLNYTTNKLTSGNDTGLLVNMTDTLSPGTSLLADFQVGGVSKAYINNTGSLFLRNNSGGGITLGTESINYVQPGNGNIIFGQTGVGYYTYITSGTAVVFKKNYYDNETVVIDTRLHTQTSDQNNIFKIVPIYNQTSGTAANTDLCINRTETAVGSGAQLLIDAQVSTVSKFSVSNRGVVTNPGTLQTLTGAGAVDIISPITHLVTTAADALTLADGAEGQYKIIIMKTDGGDGTLTPTNPGGYATITFNDVGDSAQLLFTNAAWHFIGGTATLA